jgi:hypothetical protein
MGHALLHSPARQAARGDGRALGRTRAGIWALLGEEVRRRRRVVTHAFPSADQNKANNRRPIDGRLLSKETR